MMSMSLEKTLEGQEAMGNDSLMEITLGDHQVRHHGGKGGVAYNLRASCPPLVITLRVLYLIIINMVCFQIESTLSNLSMEDEERLLNDDDGGVTVSERAPEAPVDSGRKRKNKCGSTKRKRRALKKAEEKGAMGIGGHSASGSTKVADGLATGSRVLRNPPERSVTFPSTNYKTLRFDRKVCTQEAEVVNSSSSPSNAT